MTSFNFQAVQLLEINEGDAPVIDIHENRLVLSAKRGNEHIRITAPLDALLPSARAVKVKAGSKPTTITRQPQYAKGAADGRVGVNNYMAKLTDEKVREIRQLVADKSFVESYRSFQSMVLAIAESYGVHPATIHNVIKGISWRHVKI
jgi:ribosomal protein L11